MKKLNKNRQQMYLDGKVGLINDGTVEQLREVSKNTYYCGVSKYYSLEYNSSKFPKEGVEHKPMSWFYEEEAEQPTAWKLNVDVPEWGLEKDEICLDSSQLGGLVLPPSILQHIATPIYTTSFTLENGSTINLTALDIQNIKKQ